MAPHGNNGYVTSEWRFLRGKVSAAPPRVKRRKRPYHNPKEKFISCSIEELENAIEREIELQKDTEARKAPPIVEKSTDVDERPLSPAILWKRSSHVKLAANVPKELLMDLDFKGDDESDTFEIGNVKDSSRIQIQPFDKMRVRSTRGASISAFSPREELRRVVKINSFLSFKKNFK